MSIKSTISRYSKGLYSFGRCVVLAALTLPAFAHADDFYGLYMAPMYEDLDTLMDGLEEARGNAIGNSRNTSELSCSELASKANEFNSVYEAPYVPFTSAYSQPKVIAGVYAQEWLNRCQ